MDMIMTIYYPSEMKFFKHWSMVSIQNAYFSQLPGNKKHQFLYK